MACRRDSNGAGLHLLPNASGKVNFITILLIAAVLGVGYGGYVYIPLYLQNMDVKHRCNESLNSTWRSRSAQRTKDDLLRRLHDIDTVEKEIGGDIRKVPAIDPDIFEIEFDQSQNPPVLWVDIGYEREVPLPLLGRTHVFYFSAYCEKVIE